MTPTGGRLEGEFGGDKGWAYLWVFFDDWAAWEIVGEMKLLVI